MQLHQCTQRCIYRELAGGEGEGGEGRPAGEGGGGRGGGGPGFNN